PTSCWSGQPVTAEIPIAIGCATNARMSPNRRWYAFGSSDESITTATLRPTIPPRTMLRARRMAPSRHDLAEGVDDVALVVDGRPRDHPGAHVEADAVPVAAGDHALVAVAPLRVGVGIADAPAAACRGEVGELPQLEALVAVHVRLDDDGHL